MDQHMEQWLQKHGHNNVFAFYTEEQCEELVNNIKDQLATEHQLEQAAREFVMQSQLALQSKTTETRLSHEIDEPPIHDEGKPHRRTEPIIAEPTESSGPSPTITASSGVSWLSLGLLGLMGLAVWSTALYQFALRQGKHQTKPMVAVASHCETPKQNKQRALAHQIKNESVKIPPLSTPMLIQPSLRVALSWKAMSALSAATRDPWKAPATQEPEMSAELSQRTPQNPNNQWLMPSVSKFQLNQRHSKPQRPREFFHIQPLQLTRTAF